MSIFRVFRRQRDEDRALAEMAFALEQSAVRSFPKVPLLERRTDECAGIIEQLEIDRVTLESRIEELQEELRQVNVALSAERERARIVAEGLQDVPLALPKTAPVSDAAA